MPISRDATNTKFEVKVITKLMNDPEFHQRLMKDLRLAAMMEKNERKTNGLLALDCAIRMEAMAAELDKR